MNDENTIDPKNVPELRDGSLSCYNTEKNFWSAKEESKIPIKNVLLREVVSDVVE